MDAANVERGQAGPVTSLVFPTYNPGHLLERTWTDVAHFLSRASGNWEVLFVCDGCTDGTTERLRELTNRSHQRVRILSYTPNRGKGFALRTGLAAASGAWRLFTDVDLAYGFDDILRVAERLRRGADVVIASRAHPDSQMVLPTRLQGYAYRRHLQSLVFSGMARCLLPLTVRDTQAGLKGISAAGAELIIPRLQCDGFGFDCEFLTACVRYGLVVHEVPVCVRYEDRASTTSMASMGRMLRELWRIRRTWRQAPRPEPVRPAQPRRRAA
jgi:dolichyl-phosphate beta-glucosyltransferase